MRRRSSALVLLQKLSPFAFIFLFERFRPRPETGPAYLLPELSTEVVKTVQIWPAGQLEIRAERTNGIWRLTEPVAYPAQSTKVQDFLDALQRLTIAHKISEKELRMDPKADQDYGIDPPQLSLSFNSGRSIHFGHRTSPGDQVFVRIPGIEGVAIVDAEVLNYFPQNGNSWRDTTLADLAGGDRKANAEIVRRLLRNEDHGPKRDAVLLNAAAALFVAGRSKSISAGWELAEQVITSGKARAKLTELASN